MLSQTEQPDTIGVPISSDFVKELKINTDQSTVNANIESSITRGLPQLKAYIPQSTKLILAFGGPSLSELFDEVQHKYWDGYKVVAVNGSYEFLLEKGIRPAMMVMVDARPENARFLTRPAPNCQYLIASQCAPETFDKVCSWPNEVYIWHALANESEVETLIRYYNGHNFLTASLGSTVGMRTIGLLRLMGFVWFDIYGMDSCVSNDIHHAYSQPENDTDPIIHVKQGNRWFRCSPWHLAQAQNFVEYMGEQKEPFHLQVFGDGLIAHLANQLSQGDKDGCRKLDIL